MELNSTIDPMRLERAVLLNRLAPLEDSGGKQALGPTRDEVSRLQVCGSYIYVCAHIPVPACVHPSVCPFQRPCAPPFLCPPLHPSTPPFIYPPLCPSVCLSARPLSICSSIHLSSICLPFRPSACLCVNPSVHAIHAHILSHFRERILSCEQPRLPRLLPTPITH